MGNFKQTIFTVGSLLLAVILMTVAVLIPSQRNFDQINDQQRTLLNLSDGLNDFAARAECLDTAEAQFEETLARLITAAVNDDDARVGALALELQQRAEEAKFCNEKFPVE